MSSKIRLIEEIVDQEFIDALKSEDDVGKIIKAHLHIEREINRYIDLRVKHPAELESAELDYFARVHIALAFGMPSTFKSYLLALGNMRNRCAHNLDFKLDSTGVENLYKTLTPEVKTLCQRLHAYVLGHSKSMSGLPANFRKLPPTSSFDVISVVMKAVLGIVPDAVTQLLEESGEPSRPA